MTMPPHISSQIDQTLEHVGSVEVPSGLQARVQQRLQDQHLSAQRGRFSLSVVHYVSAGALAASVAASALLWNPTVRTMVFPAHGVHAAPSGSGANAPLMPQVTSPEAGSFGTSSAVHVPLQPVPVQPTPLSQGRGHSRSGRALLPDGSLAPLPRGVASPHTLVPHTPGSSDQ